MSDTRKELIGYAGKLSAQAGDAVDFMVTSEFDEYEARIVRLIHGDVNPEGPGHKVEDIDAAVNGRYPGRRQQTHTGSFVSVVQPPATPDGFTLHAWIWPTNPVLGRMQGIMTRWSPEGGGYGLFIDETGNLTFKVRGAGGRDHNLTAGEPLRQGLWYFVAATFDAKSGEARLMSRMQPDWPISDAVVDLSAKFEPGEAAGAGGPFLIGAGWMEPSESPIPRACYNGKIENPHLFDRPLSESELNALSMRDTAVASIDGLVAAWDFAATHPSSRQISDVVGGHHGEAVNLPTRAMHGHNWDTSVYNYAEAPAKYGAIHFHDDDFEDSRWQADFTWEIPDGLRSGCYAARLEAGGVVDYIPFFVRPPDGTATAEILYLMPTNNYLAYANESVIWSGGFDFTGLTNVPIVIDPYDVFLDAHHEFGASLYDVHSDGSGIAYSHYLRPIVSMRPTHRHWVSNGPRHFPFDLNMVDWLEAKGFRYDVATDEDLHKQGTDLLSRYKVLVTGSHPEYWTEQMLDALESYLHQGGHLAYLGGNGFYWVTAFDPERDHVIEVRRGFSGSRAWDSHPGEVYLASTGELGGIWRHRGRPPNLLAGTGFTAQGWDLKAPGYKRLADSHDPRAAFIFEGIGDDEVIGDFGLVMGGAAGDELDRIEPALGSPPHALRLATSEGLHSDFYLVTRDEMNVMTREIHGTDNSRVRADMVYFETQNGGAVFSVSSINWFGSLSHNSYDNNVSRITENVLRAFTA